MAARLSTCLWCADGGGRRDGFGEGIVAGKADRSFWVYAEFEGDKRVSPWRKAREGEDRPVGLSTKVIDLGRRQREAFTGYLAALREETPWPTLIPSERFQTYCKLITPDDVWIDVDRAADRCWDLTLRSYGIR